MNTLTNSKMLAVLVVTLAASSAGAQNVVIDSVRVETGAGETIENAQVVITKGRIVSVGKAKAAPKGHRVISGKGKVLTPGLVETQAQVGLSDIMFDENESDSVLRDGTLKPGFKAAEGFNPSSIWLPIQREGGVTSVVLAPLGGMISGTGSWMELTGKLELPNTTPAFMGLDLDAAGRGASGKSRGGMWMKLREIFADARLYAKNKSAYDKAQMRKTQMSGQHLAAMAPVLNRQIPLVVEVHRASDILQTLAFAKAQKIDVVLKGASESWRVAKEIKAAKVAVILQPNLQVPWGFQTLYARDDVATLLHNAGVEVILSAGLDWDQNIRRLRQQAGMAVAHGLPWQVALSSITQTPATAFGRNDVGVIEKGKRANVVLWSGDPLELSSVAELILIDGVEYSTDNRQRMLSKKYLSKQGKKE